MQLHSTVTETLNKRPIGLKKKTESSHNQNGHSSRFEKESAPRKDSTLSRAPGESVSNDSKTLTAVHFKPKVFHKNTDLGSTLSPQSKAHHYNNQHGQRNKEM
jgi:hypothetical protein